MTEAATVVGFLKMTAGVPSIGLFVAYLAMIALSGWWQRLSSPLTLKWPLVVHNFGCCLISLLTFCGFGVALYHNGSLYGKTPNPFLSNIFKVYWITKIVELLDTVFMVLRHRRRQISFLHVYHHASMLLLSDLGQRFYPWPAIATFLAINSLVHVILYLYYGLTALHPLNPPKWKKEMTQVQILQFLVGFVIAGYGYVYHNFCIYSMLYGVTMITLFSNFYFHAYIKKRKLQMDGAHKERNGSLHQN